MSKGLLIAGVVLLIVLVAVAVFWMQPGADEADVNAGVEEEIGNLLDNEGNQTEEIPVETQPSVTKLTIEADDDGFYMGGQDINSISATQGENLEITFNVRTTRVYYAGLDFKGCGIDTGKVAPGASETVQVVASNTCTITSYWPSSGVVKDTLQLVVG